MLLMTFKCRRLGKFKCSINRTHMTACFAGFCNQHIVFPCSCDRLWVTLVQNIYTHGVVCPLWLKMESGRSHSFLYINFRSFCERYALLVSLSFLEDQANCFLRCQQVQKLLLDSILHD